MNNSLIYDADTIIPTNETAIPLIQIALHQQQFRKIFKNIQVIDQLDPQAILAIVYNNIKLYVFFNYSLGRHKKIIHIGDLQIIYNTFGNLLDGIKIAIRYMERNINRFINGEEDIILRYDLMRPLTRDINKTCEYINIGFNILDFKYKNQITEILEESQAFILELNNDEQDDIIVWFNSDDTNFAEGKAVEFREEYITFESVHQMLQAIYTFIDDM